MFNLFFYNAKKMISFIKIEMFEIQYCMFFSKSLSDFNKNFEILSIFSKLFEILFSLSPIFPKLSAILFSLSPIFS